MPSLFEMLPDSCESGSEVGRERSGGTLWPGLLCGAWSSLGAAVGVILDLRVGRVDMVVEEQQVRIIFRAQP